MALAFLAPHISETTSVNKKVNGYVIMPVVKAWAVGLKGPLKSFTPIILVSTSTTENNVVRMRYV